MIQCLGRRADFGLFFFPACPLPSVPACQRSVIFMNLIKSIPFLIRDPQALFRFGLCTAALAVLYYPVLRGLVHDWIDLPDDSLAFLIPLVSAYLIWQQSAKLESLPRSPGNSGILLVILGLFLLILGNLAAEHFTSRISLLVVLSGLTWYLVGLQHLRLISFAIAYLVFMIPLPSILLDKITFPLQLFASKVAAESLQLVGIPVLREGNIIHLASNSLEVAEACSGLRSLISLLALGIIFAYFSQKFFWKRALLVLACVPIAVIVNALRVSVTGALAHYYGMVAADGFFHGFSGFVVFIAAFVMMGFVGMVLSQIGKTRD
jgi:exosortase